MILPTHTCFDDALELLTDRLQADPALARNGRLWLVHGIAYMPEHQADAGRPFAHGWVEEAGYCYTQGLVNGERVLLRQWRHDFYQRLRITQTTRYTPRHAWRENVRTRHYGPWRAEYLALLRTTDDRAEAGR